MVITINKPELARLIGFMWKQRPGLHGISVRACTSGWATVDVPNWEGTRPELYSLAQGRIYGPESYLNKAKEAT
jgi:hypothetical protein